VATPDIFDSVLSDVATGKRKSPLTKRSSPDKSGPATPPKAMVDKFVTMLTPLDDKKRQATIDAFNAAVDQVSNADEQEPADDSAAQDEDEPSATG
jgi:predicted transcriptional regulator